MGKRQIKKVDCPKARNVCFTKRRQGLFKKAAELSRLHNVQIAAVAFSPAGTPFEFGNTSLLFDRYIATTCPPSSSSSSSSASDSAINKFNHPLFDVDISKLTLSELKDYASNLNKWKSDLLMSLEENQLQKEDEVKKNESDGDGVEFTFEELMCDITEDENDLDFHSRVEGMEEEYEEMLREMLVHDDDDDDTNPIHSVGEFDDYFAGLSADEFINELLSVD